MTEQDRLDRETLLKRAAAAAGAIYVAPALTSLSGATEPQTCTGQRCKRGRRGRRFCRRQGGPGCACDPATLTCKSANPCSDGCQRSEQPCAPLFPCNTCCHNNCCWSGVPSAAPGSSNCGCWIVAGSGGKHVCARAYDCGSSGLCDKETGQGCGFGECCLDTCCPTGICGYLCFSAMSPPELSRRTGNHGLPYLVSAP